MIALSPNQSSALFLARRPGTESYVYDLNKLALSKTIQSPQGKHFYGHGCYHPSGKIGYTTENDYIKGLGLVGVYDFSTEAPKRLNEFPLPGIGPHQIQFLNQTEELVVAIGGIQTHPDSGRQKLNLRTMASGLAYLSSESGELTAFYRPPDPQMSIRHLDVAGDTVYLGVQYEGPEHRNVPLVGYHRPGMSDIRWLETPLPYRLALANYISSIKATDDFVVATSSHGHCITVWDTRNGRFIEQISCNDVSGVIFSERMWSFTTGLGQVLTASTNISPNPSHSPTVKLELQTDQSQWRFDNHLQTFNRGRDKKV